MNVDATKDLERAGQSLWRWGLIGGLITIGLGIALLAWPGATLTVVAWIFGFQLVAWGIMLIMARVVYGESGGQIFFGVIAGVLTILAGMAAFRAPGRTLILLGLFLGAAWVVSGLFELVESLTDTTMPDRGWRLFSGFLSVLAGIVVMSFPVNSLAALALWGGLLMIMMGVVRVMAAFQAKNLGLAVADQMAPRAAG